MNFNDPSWSHAHYLQPRERVQFRTPKRKQWQSSHEEQLELFGLPEATSVNVSRFYMSEWKIFWLSEIY